jgi:predicted  nucleic acid-binding Zn-ribbon protein
MKETIIGALIGLAVGFLLFRGRPASPVVIARVDTVLAESPAAKAARDSLSREAAVYEKLAAQRSITASVMKGRADSAQAALDSATTTRDSLWAAVQGFQARTEEVGTLRAALDAQMVATANLRALAGLSESRIVTLETTLREARAELVKARRPGRFGLGCTGGYGIKGPDAVCGLTVRIF